MMNSKKIKLLLVLGTRPEAVKMSQLIKQGEIDPRFEIKVCSTGQHREMIRPLFDFFRIQPDSDFDLMRPGQNLHDIATAIMQNLHSEVLKDRPDWILVQGDTTTVFAASVYAFYNKIRLGHIEAGLRTHDIHSPFPEEFNRRVTGLIADLHFAPTQIAAANLVREGTPTEKIHVTGNTGIDALFAVLEGIEKDSKYKQIFQEKFHFLNPAKRIVLLTVHRRESFGPPMDSIFSAINQLADREDVEILIPLHFNPIVRAQAQAKIKPSKNIHICDPLDYLEFVYIMKKSHLILTDSGGIQEEAPSLGKPVLVLRENTERPEAIAAGTSKLIGTKTDRILKEVQILLENQSEYDKMSSANNPFGDGNSSKKILDILAGAQP